MRFFMPKMMHLLREYDPKVTLVQFFLFSVFDLALLVNPVQKDLDRISGFNRLFDFHAIGVFFTPGAAVRVDPILYQKEILVFSIFPLDSTIGVD